MSYTKESLEKNQVKFTFDVESNDWKDAINEAYNKSKGKFQIGGFRKGHVPRKIIESMYGVGVFFDDALDIILPKYYEAALKENSDLFPVEKPEIDLVSIDENSVKFTAVVQLKPEVTLGAYTGLTFKKDKVKVTKDEIKAEIDKAIEAAGAWENVTDRAVINGDKLLINYSGSIDGVKFDGGTANNQPLEIGSGNFIPGFEEQIIGMNIGENRDIKVTFPVEYGAKELAGKEAVFAVTVNEISSKIVPTYDNEFVKDISEFDTVEKFESSIKAKIKAKKEKDSEFKLENDIVETIAKNAQVEVPTCMIEQEANHMVEEFEYSLMYKGMDKDAYYKFTNSTQQDLKAKYMENAGKNVKIKLVLEALMKEISIPVSQEEIEEAIVKMAEQAQKEVEEYKKLLNDEYMDYICQNITTGKLLEYLKSNNEIK